MTRPSPLTLHPGAVTLAELRRIHDGDARLAMDPRTTAGIDAARGVVDDIVSRDAVVYGINTGFGKLAQTRIAHDRLAELQRNLVRSHATGVGAPLADGVVRLVLATKAVSLARGHSGVRAGLVDALVALVNAGVSPRIPQKGSVGASGDLAPLAHLAAVLIGEGEAIVDGVTVSGAEALRHAGIAPFVLGPKEGLALLNGTQVSTALALAALFDAEKTFAAALVAGALSLEAIRGSVRPLDARIHVARGQRGQIAVAAGLRALLADSGIVESHAQCGRVQDPYSIRCMPQVMGACLDNLAHAGRVLEIEANAASDNPLVFAASGEVLSGGNFHAEPVAFAADALALAIAEIGAIAERRIALLIDASLSGLPPFLVAEGGINSGFMIAHVTAAALASENKSLAHPASVDTIPTSANREDHVSMGVTAARHAERVVLNTAKVLGIEILCAAQGLDLGERLRPGRGVAAAYKALRRHVRPLRGDRYLAPDLAVAERLVLDGSLLTAVERAVGELAV
ncbi:MAG TPA: histidine ammonia-lyase [Casimicrobiaceae bacterium]|nr:histidine ammonia-lyase [Casimicrobiaceae bacterium]